MPDKAIDLVDEACAMVRTEIDSMPTELDVITRREKVAIGDVRGLREAIEQVRRDIDGLNGSTI